MNYNDKKEVTQMVEKVSKSMNVFHNHYANKFGGRTAESERDIKSKPFKEAEESCDKVTDVLFKDASCQPREFGDLCLMLMGGSPENIKEENHWYKQIMDQLNKIDKTYGTGKGNIEKAA
jgi:archaellum component FlaC